MAHPETPARPGAGHEVVPTGVVDRWLNDEAAWPELCRLYEELTGERLRAPTSADLEQHVKPLLRRAFERGELVVGSPRSAPTIHVPEEGVHGKYQPPPEAPPPQAKPPPIAAPASPDETVPPDSVDQDQQAETLVAASAAGVPFCEECEKARQEQAAGAEA